MWSKLDLEYCVGANGLTDLKHVHWRVRCVVLCCLIRSTVLLRIDATAQ